MEPTLVDLTIVYSRHLFVLGTHKPKTFGARVTERRINSSTVKEHVAGLTTEPYQ